MTKSHKHSELIKAWADGAEIEYRSADNYWYPTDTPEWLEDEEYRIKPEKKLDCWYELAVKYSPSLHGVMYEVGPRNLRLIFDGETGKLKEAKVLA